jgi:hypothetical protein
MTNLILFAIGVTVLLVILPIIEYLCDNKPKIDHERENRLTARYSKTGAN